MEGMITFIENLLSEALSTHGLVEVTHTTDSDRNHYLHFR